MLYSKGKCVAGSLLFSLYAVGTAASADPVAGKLTDARTLIAIDKPLPDYPRYADIRGVDGYAVLEFTVTPEGAVAEPAVRDHSSFAFSEAALDAVETWRFEPVYENGVAVPVRTGVKVSFVPRME